MQHFWETLVRQQRSTCGCDTETRSSTADLLLPAKKVFVHSSAGYCKHLHTQHWTAQAAQAAAGSQGNLS